MSNSTPSRKNEAYKSDLTLNAMLEALPDLLQTASKSNLPIYKNAFLIIHEATGRGINSIELVDGGEHG